MSALVTARARVVVGLIGLMAMGAAATVSASELQGPDVVVRFGDLDLHTQTGAETLYTRIQLAAAQVCSRPESYELQIRAAAVRCQNELVARTVAGLRSPELAAVYGSHHSKHRPV